MLIEREILFSILAFIITFWTQIIYWHGILRGDIIPHPFSMFIWVVVLGISSIELVARGEYLWSISIIFITMNTFFAMLVGMYWWKRIISNRMDWFFLFSGIFLIIFWRLEPNYTYVLFIMMAIDATAYASSFKKAWLQPWTEKSLPYFLSIGSYLCTIFSISVWNFENIALWVWTASVNLVFACFIVIRQYHIKK